VSKFIVGAHARTRSSSSRASGIEIVEKDAK